MDRYMFYYEWCDMAAVYYGFIGSPSESWWIVPGTYIE